MPNGRLDNERVDARMGDLSPTKILREIEKPAPAPQPTDDQQR